MPDRKIHFCSKFAVTTLPCYQGRSQPHSPGWARVPLSSFFLKSRLSFLIFPQTFTHFLPHFGPPGKALATPLRATIANADIESLKSLHTFFTKCLYHMLVKFEQIRIVQTTRNFELFDKKLGFLKTTFDKALTPFWKTFLQLNQLSNAQLLI